MVALFFTAKEKQSLWPSFEPMREKVQPATHSARVKDADAQHTHSTGSWVTSLALQFPKIRCVEKNETNLYFKGRCSSCIEFLGKYVKQRSCSKSSRLKQQLACFKVIFDKYLHHLQSKSRPSNVHQYGSHRFFTKISEVNIALMPFCSASSLTNKYKMLKCYKILVIQNVI